MEVSSSFSVMFKINISNWSLQHQWFPNIFRTKLPLKNLAIAPTANKLSRMRHRCIFIFLTLFFSSIQSCLEINVSTRTNVTPRKREPHSLRTTNLRRSSFRCFCQPFHSAVDLRYRTTHIWLHVHATHNTRTRFYAYFARYDCCRWVYQQNHRSVKNA